MLRPEGANALQTVLLSEMREKRDLLDDFAPQNEREKRHVGWFCSSKCREKETCWMVLLLKMRGKRDMLDGFAPRNEGNKTCWTVARPEASDLRTGMRFVS